MKIKIKTLLILFKIGFEILLLILFLGSYIKIYNSLEPKIFIKLIFSILYLWFSIGININFIFPLLKLIDNKINKYNY